MSAKIIPLPPRRTAEPPPSLTDQADAVDALHGHLSDIAPRLIAHSLEPEEAAEFLRRLGAAAVTLRGLERGGGAE